MTHEVRNKQGNDDVPIVCFQDIECTIHFDRYSNKRIVMPLIDGDGFPYSRATVNVPEAQIEPGEMLIKDWSENAGMLDALVEAGVVEDTGCTVPTGRARYIVKLLITPPANVV